MLATIEGDVRVAPLEENHGVDEEGEDEVETYTANHDEHTLPSGLGAELPRLGILLELLHIEALIDHTSNLDIATEGEPTHNILGLATLGLEAQDRFAEEE